MKCCQSLFLISLLVFTIIPTNAKIIVHKEFTCLKSGLIKHTLIAKTSRGKIELNVLEVDLLNKDISIKIGLTNNKKIKERNPLLKITNEEKACAGINANYFDLKNGNPLGTIMKDGKWIVSPIFNRASIGFADSNEVKIAQVKLKGIAYVYHKKEESPFLNFDIDSLNTPSKYILNAGIYTRVWDKFLNLENHTAIVVKRDRIKEIIESKEAKIPRNGSVIIIKNKKLANQIKKDDYIDMYWETIPDWSDVQEAVGGGPYLVKNGMVFVDEFEEKFHFSKKEQITARSAIGIDQKYKLYLITSEGKRAIKNHGLLLIELANVLKEFGLYDAINLDGGSSTTLVVNDEIINSLSENHERRISTGVLIFCK